MRVPPDMTGKYLKFKIWYWEYSIADEIIFVADQFVEDAANLFEIMKPFNDYLNKAFEGFQMPTR